MDTSQLLPRMLAALVVGAIIGLDRDLTGKPAGLRTHALVCIGSAALVLSALLSGAGAEGVSRGIQGLVAGIGFLGAGVIVHHERKHRVQGLTTAASIWVAAGLGAACGLGLYRLVALALVMALFVLLAGGPIERTLAKRFGREKPRSPPPGDEPPG